MPKMKIGILTFHRAHNYGAVLQCYALQEVLRDMGHEVEIIDYRQPAIEECYKTMHISMLLKRFIKIWELYPYVSRSLRRHACKQRFSSFRSKYLNISEPCTMNDIPQSYDCYIIGSDQLWSDCVGFDKIYNGDFVVQKHSKIVGYAISSTIGYLKKTYTNESLKQYCSNFFKLSFREESISNYIEERTGIQCDTVVDPTLLTTSKTWSKIIDNGATHKRPYIVVYQARGYNKDPFFLTSKAKSFADSLKLDIVDLSDSNVYVQEFVSIINNAECIITSSFHATAFSLILHKPLFAYCYNDGHDGRYKDLLNKVGLGYCVVNADYNPKSIPIIDYNDVDCRMMLLRENSLTYLESL